MSIVHMKLTKESDKLEQLDLFHLEYVISNFKSLNVKILPDFVETILGSVRRHLETQVIIYRGHKMFQPGLLSLNGKFILDSIPKRLALFR